MFSPVDAAGWAAYLGIAATLVVATVSGLRSVRVRVEENKRAEWRRLEELNQILHNGAAKGLWAQRVAVEEMLTLTRRKKEVTALLRDASQHFRRAGTSGTKLADYIDERLPEGHSLL